VATGTIRIRKATLHDLEQVTEFTHDTFSWGDYLPQAWARLVESKRGDLLVADVDRQVVGTIRAGFLGNGEAWLEAVRVRHEFRQRGIASLLIQAAHARAIKKRCRVIRLETYVHNIPAHRAFEKIGYRPQIEYSMLEAKTRAGELDFARTAKLTDMDACLEMWERSWLKRFTKGLVPADFGWRWWEFTPGRLRQAIREKRVYLAPQEKMPRGFMITRLRDSFEVTVMVGAPRAAMKLFDAAKILAANAEQENVYWLAPHIARAKKWAADAGFAPDEDGLLIYACEL